MYDFEFHYSSPEEPEELWTWCSKHLTGSFWFRPENINIMDAEYNPMMMIETYTFGDCANPRDPQKPYTLLIKIRDNNDAATFKLVWENLC